MSGEGFLPQISSPLTGNNNKNQQSTPTNHTYNNTRNNSNTANMNSNNNPHSFSPFHQSATFGDMFGASIHFWLESLVARCRCDRIALFLPHPKYMTLVRVAVVGPHAPSVLSQNSAVGTGGIGKGDTPGVAGPVTISVLRTGVAANLTQVAAEDSQDCPGSSIAKTALAIPIKPFHMTERNNSIGVLFAVNKHSGNENNSIEAFNSEDQAILCSVAPSIAYLAETYPVDFSAHRFDPSPLHQILNLQRNSPHRSSNRSSRGGSSSNRHQSNDDVGKGGRRKSVFPHQKRSSSTSKRNSSNTSIEREDSNNLMLNSLTDNNQNTNQNNTQLALPEKPPQLVYEQNGPESMLPYVAKTLEEQKIGAASAGGVVGSGSSSSVAAAATQQQQQNNTSTTSMFDNSRAINDIKIGDGLTTAQQIQSVGDFVDRMEQCWRDSVSRCIATERELTLRSAQVVDAHAILHRKQRRLEVLKDVLVETLEKRF